MVSAPFLISLLVLIVVAGLIYQYVIPLLPPPFYRIAQIILALAIIVWLLRVFGIY